LSLTVMAPDAAPCAGGVNVTDTAQLVAGNNTEGQLFVSANGPEAANVSPLMLLPPKLDTVMVCAALGEPTFCENVNAGGVKLIAEGRGVGKDRGAAP
jgi:hypothetical protein